MVENAGFAKRLPLEASKRHRSSLVIPMSEAEVEALEEPQRSAPLAAQRWAFQQSRAMTRARW